MLRAAAKAMKIGKKKNEEDKKKRQYKSEASRVKDEYKRKRGESSRLKAPPKPRSGVSRCSGRKGGTPKKG
jgi:hypothetical protein